MKVMEDPFHSLTVEEVAAAGPSSFQELEGEALDLGMSRSVHWFRFQLHDPSGRKWWLEFDNGAVDTATLYVPKGDGTFEVMYSGANVALSDRKVPERTVLFPLFPDHTPKTYFLRIQSDFPINGRFSLLPPDHFRKKELRSLFLYVGYTTLAGFMVLMALIYFWKFRDPIFLFYIGAACCMVSGILLISGVGMKYVWPEGFYFRQANSPVLVFLSVFFVNGLVRRLVMGQRFAPRIDKVAMIVQFIALGLLIFPLIGWPGLRTLNDMSIFLDLISITLLTLLGIQALRGDYPPAKTYFIGFAGLAVGVLTYILGDYFNLMDNDLGHLTLAAGSVWEMVFFMISMVTRFKLLEQEKEASQEEAEAFRTEVARLEKAIEEQKEQGASPLPDHIKPLTQREREVLRHIARGSTDQRIAEELSVSLTTVKTHARNIYSKLLVSNRAEAVAVANQYGFLAPSSE